jgi:hypothetical protein
MAGVGFNPAPTINHLIFYHMVIHIDVRKSLALKWKYRLSLRYESKICLAQLLSGASLVLVLVGQRAWWAIPVA